MPLDYQPRRRPHIELRHRTYLAVLEIPRQLRRKLGRRFVKSLETDSPTVAERRAAPLIAGWRRQIAEARGEADDDTAFFRRALHNAGSDAEREAIKRRAWNTAYLGWAAAPDQSDYGKPPGDDPEAAAFFKKAVALPFDDYLVEWQATARTTAKTKDMQATDIRRFTAIFPTVADVTKPAVKRWTGTLLASGLAPATVHRTLSSLRGYWRHLQAIDAAPDVDPFTGLNLATQGGRVTSEDQRKAFTPADVVKLLGKAREQGDDDLADLIDVARWSGARIEEICALKIESIHLTAAVPYFKIIAGKTDAAVRDVPAHAKLLPVLQRLVGKRTVGFLLAGLTANKYSGRSNAIGKRFGRMKASLGFGEQFVFHSIRKTVATMFKDASVPEATAADILGHDIATMSYGLYASNVSLTTKVEAIAKLHYP
jgi:integrase